MTPPSPDRTIPAPVLPTPPPRGRFRLDVVGVGEISVDDVLLVSGQRSPTWGAKLRVARRERLGGGQVATAMVAARRLGLASGIIGFVGDDEPGLFALDGLREAGVDVEGVVIGAGATRHATVVIDAAGERTVLWNADPNLTLEPSHLDSVLVAAGRILHLDGTQHRASVAAARIARAAGSLVSCDLDTYDQGSRELLSLVDLCIVSSSFLSTFAGRESLEVPEPEALRRLARAAAPGALVCVTLGAWGAAALDGSEMVRGLGFQRQNVVDTTACGDTFRAGFLAAFLDGRDLTACLRYANAAAALKTRDLGRRGCPTRGEVESFLRVHA